MESREPSEVAFAHLRATLAATGPGPVARPALSSIEAALAHVWHLLDGGEEEGMEGRKVLRRMQKALWMPPCLTFRIERHGGTVQGSTRAELQEWVVNFDLRSADVANVGFRQVRPRRPALDVQPIAAELAAAVLAGADHPFLELSPDRLKVRVLTGSVPGLAGPMPARTVQGRRKRFRDCLVRALAGSTWKRIPGTPTFVHQDASSGPRGMRRTEVKAPSRSSRPRTRPA